MSAKTNKPKKLTKDVKKAKYYDLKRRLLSWEEHNYSQLALIETGNGWYKMFGNSAVIYACQVANRLNLKAELISDTDYEVMSDKPVCLIKNLVKLELLLESIGIKRSSSSSGAFVYDLGYKVDACDLAELQKESELVRERTNKLVMPKEVLPGLRNELRILTKGVYEISRKMNPVAREIAGNDMTKICARMFVNFIDAANGHSDMRQYLKTSVKDLRRLDAILLLISDLRLVEDDKNYDLVLQVGRVQKKVAAVLVKTEKGRI